MTLRTYGDPHPEPPPGVLLAIILGAAVGIGGILYLIFTH